MWSNNLTPNIKNNTLHGISCLSAMFLMENNFQKISIYNYHQTSDEVLTVENDDDQHFNYRLKLGQDGIITYNRSAKSTRKLPLFNNLSNK